MLRVAVLIACCLLLGCPAAKVSARVSDLWDYKRLFKEANLIVIASAMASERTADRLTDHPWPVEIVGRNTSFEVRHVVKGKRLMGRLKVLHYEFGDCRKDARGRPRRDRRPTPIIDGPLFVTFRAKPLRVKLKAGERSVPRPEYLLFLKRRKDGRFEPVSGPLDPQDSVRTLFADLPAELGGE